MRYIVRLSYSHLAFASHFLQALLEGPVTVTFHEILVCKNGDAYVMTYEKTTILYVQLGSISSPTIHNRGQLVTKSM